MIVLADRRERVQVHGIDVAEKVVVRNGFDGAQALEFFRALPPCLIGMERAPMAHYWAREPTKLAHEVRRCREDVKAYVKRRKSMRLTLRRSAKWFVLTDDVLLCGSNWPEQQGQSTQHRTRDAPTRQRTQIITLWGASGRAAGLGGGAGHAGSTNRARSVTHEQDTRSPIDARASSSSACWPASLRRWKKRLIEAIEKWISN